MKPDINSSADLEIIIRSFYSKSLTDNLLKPIFDKANLDLEEHLPRMIAFWNQVVLDKSGYEGSPIPMHIALNKLISVKKEHFERWVDIFEKTVNENFAGENADKMITRAKSISTVIQTKIYQDEQNNRS